uniref:Disease resistance protein At4g27190-like leucine-rich repeats domain-containing protein n=1 Tax=Vitis vinifera TaxID=29760 RepID=F6HIQ1_VITVI
MPIALIPYNIRALWPDQLLANSFSKLRKLQVKGCKKLLNLFPVSVASAPVQLEDLNLLQSGVEAVVHNENEDEAAPLLLFPNLTSLELAGLHQLKRFCSRRFSSSWPLLKELEVLYCDKVEILFQQINYECELEPLFWVEQVALPGLESVSVCGLDNIRALWPDQLPANSFSKLRKLQVRGCNKLLNLFPVSVASALVQLENLNIFYSGVEAIVHNENEDEAALLLLFPNLTSLTLSGLHQLKRFCSRKFSSSWPLLKELEVLDCDKVEILFQQINSECELEPLFWVEQVALPGLESFSVCGLDNIRALWPDQLPANSFSKLRELQVRGCNKLLNLFPVSVASALVQLENLNIFQSGVEAIVANENEDEAAPLLLFPNLTSLTLSGLHQLKRFCSRRFSSSWPLLKELEVLYCDKVEILFQQINSECELEPLFWVEQVALQGLESLYVCGLDNIRALWPDQLPTNSFSKLRKLHVRGFNKLLNLFRVSVASALVQLEDLYISESGVEAIVANENEDEAAPLLLFPNLTSLTLSGLHQLKRFCSRRFSSSWLLLKELEVLDCDKVEILFQQINSECELEPLFWVEQVRVYPALNFLNFICYIIDLSLESLSVRGLDNIRALWSDQLPANSFSKLRKLQVRGCNKLLNLFPVSVASALVQLEDLYISESGVEAIVANENEDEAALLLLFPNLTSLTLSGLHQLKRFFSRRFSSSWPLLKELEVLDCDKVEILFQQINYECELEPLFWVEQVALPGLESLSVRGLDNIRALWPDQLPANSFSKLRKLQVRGCNKLLNLFPVSVASALVHLEDLYISESGVEAIVANENEDEAAPLLLFPNLTSLTLSGLHQLKRFCSRRFSSSWPLLKELEVLDCDKVEILFQQINSECELEPLFWVEQVAFPGLESLYVRELDNIRALWSDQLPANSFSKLRKLKVIGCNKLLNLFPLSVASALVQLEELHIWGGEVEAIVSNENEDEAVPLLLFPNLTSLKLCGLHQLKRFCSGRFSSSWPLLKKLKVHECDEVEILFQQKSLECELEPLFWVEQEAFPNLEELTLNLKGTVEIWRGQFSRVSFSKLSYLNIEQCQGISVVIPSNMVQILHNLEELEVDMCDSMNEVIQVEIVGNDGHELIDNEIEFTRLKSLTLHHLPNLKSFCSSTRYVFKFPSLERMKVRECRGMEFFYKGVLDAPRLKSVQNEFFEECWQDDLNTTIRKMFMEQGYKEEDSEKSDSINSDLREEDFEED